MWVATNKAEATGRDINDSTHEILTLREGVEDDDDDDDEEEEEEGREPLAVLEPGIKL